MYSLKSIADAFNAGGEVNFSNIPNGSTAQDDAWRTIFSTAIGTLKLEKGATSRTGNAGTIATLGYTTLTSSYPSDLHRY